MTTATKNNIRQFPTAKSSTKSAIATAAAAEEKMDRSKIDKLTAYIFAISLQPSFKENGYRMEHLATAALSVAMQYQDGSADEGVALTKELLGVK